MVAALALLAAATAVAAGARATPTAAERTPTLGIESRPGKIARLSWFDPISMRALPGRNVPIGDYTAGWSFSADRSLLALGHAGLPKLRFVDTRAMRLRGDLWLTELTGFSGRLDFGDRPNEASRPAFVALRLKGDTQRDPVYSPREAHFQQNELAEWATPGSSEPHGYWARPR